jgi:hypothetical protein
VIRELVLWALLSACSYRLTRLIIRDTFPPVLWIRDRLAGGWRKLTDAEWRYVRGHGKDNAFDLLKGERPAFQVTEVDGETNRWVERAKWSPDWLAELITCPWCASAYVSGALVGITDCVIGIQWPWLMGISVWAVAAPVTARNWP